MSGVANAQGLYGINPNEDENESSPLKWTASAAVGYDDNVSPTSGLPEDSSGYVRGELGANLVVRDPQSSWDINAVVGGTHYFDDLTGGADDSQYNARLAFNLNHHLSDRTRFVNRTFLNHGIDLDYAYGASISRQSEEFLYLSTDNAIGHRWTERFATYTGISYSLLNYDASGQDVETYGVYNDFRYSVGPQTVLTATYRFTTTDHDNGRDSDNHFFLVGFDRRLSETATLVGRFGAQLRSVDGGTDDETSPFVQMAYHNRINGQFKVRAFLRYSIEDTDTVFGTGSYDNKEAFRIGFAADYVVSPQLTLTAGANYVTSQFNDGTAGLVDGDWDLFNLYVGATYKISDALSVRGTYNFTDSSASGLPVNRDYDQNRFELGLRYNF